MAHETEMRQIMRNRYFNAAAGALNLAIACGAMATAPSPKTHYYFSEFVRPVKGAETVASVNVVFFSRPRTLLAEVVLRAEMTTAMAYLRPTFEILGYAWFSPTGDEGHEEAIKLTDRADGLLFERSTGKIRPFNVLQELKKSGPTRSPRSSLTNTDASG